MYRFVHILENGISVIIIGLTGGIASGKSTVSAIFKKAGAVILDADRISREAVAPGRPAWHEVCELFGETILNSDDTLNRIELGQRVFNNVRLRHRLEQIIHPHVFNHIALEINRLKRTQPDAVVVEDIPLLFETGMIHGFDEIIVVYAHPILQLKRLMKRDSMDIETARDRLKAQMPISEKCCRATMLICNSEDFSALEREVQNIYIRLACFSGTDNCSFRSR